MFNNFDFNESAFNGAAPAVATSSGPLTLVGAVLEMDLGTGALETIPVSSLAPDVRFTSSLAGFGTQELSFALLGDAAVSPIKFGLWRGQRRTRLTFYRGTPGHVTGAIVFDGLTREITWQDFPQRADVVCQDLSLQFSQALVTYQLAAFASKTRTQVLADVLAGIPTGTIDCPGTVYKAIQEGGTQALLQWLASFVAPASRRCYWRNGLLYVMPCALGTPTRTLRPADVRGPIKVTMPPTDTPNTITQTAMIYSYLGNPGSYTTITTVSTLGSYTPAAAVRKQDHTSGVISSVSPSVTPQTEIGRVVTTTVYSGGTITSRTVETYTWYAPKACSVRQTASAGLAFPTLPATHYNDAFDVYDFSGAGDWRSQSTETFQITTKTVLTKTFDGAQRNTANNTDVYRVVPQFLATGRGSVASYSAPTYYVNWDANVYVGPDGNAWVGGVESLIRSESLYTWYGFNSSGTINNFSVQFSTDRTCDVAAGASLLVKGVGAPLYPGTGQLVFAGADGSWCFCSRSTVPYIGLSYNWAVIYTDLADGASHTEAYFGGTTLATLFVYQSATPPSPERYMLTDISSAPVTAASGTVAGTSPRAEVLTAAQVPQPVSDDSSSAVLVALNGTIPSSAQNDFAETIGEIQAIGAQTIRDTCSPIIEITMPPDGEDFAGDTITLSGFDRLSHGDINVLVDEVSVTLNMATGTGEKTLRCIWYPPELEP